jgi:hypothetical protein
MKAARSSENWYVPPSPHGITTLKTNLDIPKYHIVFYDFCEDSLRQRFSTAGP